MEDKIKIIDKSGDKEFFTIIPNYILNHSTSEEQILYTHMKRFAGDKGQCFATQQTLADKLGWGRKKVGTTIRKLLKRGWIKQAGTKIFKTSPVKVYEVVNLWKLNSDFYHKKRRVKMTHLSKKLKRGESKRPTTGESKRPLEEEQYKEDKERELTPFKEMELFLEGDVFFNEIAKEVSGKENLSLSVVVAQLQSFRSYWSERNKSGKKQKWELEKTFELKRRIGTWMRKAEQFGDIQKEVNIRKY